MLVPPLINQLEILFRAALGHYWIPLLHPTSLFLFKSHLPFKNNQALTCFKRVLRFFQNHHFILKAFASELVISPLNKKPPQKHFAYQRNRFHPEC